MADRVRVYALGPRAAVLQPWRCDGTLTSGRPCEKLLAEVDYDRPLYVRIVCPRCGHENTLVEPHRRPPEPSTPDSGTMGARPV